MAVTRDGSGRTRAALLAAARFLLDALRATPDAWDTFEVMTGTPGCLTTPAQVDEYVVRSRARPLSVAFTVGELDRRGAGAGAGPENAEVEVVIGRVAAAGAGRRIADLSLDVHCNASHEVYHALRRLFAPPPEQPADRQQQPPALRRLALVGNLQLDYILAQQATPPTPSTPSTPPTHSTFSSLNHLTIAYCPIYALALDTTMHTVESLTLAMTYLAPPPPLHSPSSSASSSAPSSAPNSLIALLRAFPSLRTLELHTLTYALGYDPRHTVATVAQPQLQLDALDELVLDAVPLDCELFAALRCPHLRRLALRDVLPEPDGTSADRTNRSDRPSSRSESAWNVTARFDAFVRAHDWARLDVLEVERVYVGVRGTSMGLVTAAAGRLRALTLGGFAWDDCAALLTPAPAAARVFPALERLVVRLDADADALAAPDHDNHHHDHHHHHHHHDDAARRAWMDGLAMFARGRIALDTIAEVLFRGYTNAPGWLRALGQRAPGWRVAHDYDHDHDHDDPGYFVHSLPLTMTEAEARTLAHVSLETSFQDSYTFVWSDYERLRDAYEPSCSP
jgi:hypothetical protein